MKLKKLYNKYGVKNRSDLFQAITKSTYKNSTKQKELRTLQAESKAMPKIRKQVATKLKKVNEAVKKTSALRKTKKAQYGTSIKHAVKTVKMRRPIGYRKPNKRYLDKYNYVCGYKTIENGEQKTQFVTITSTAREGKLDRERIYNEVASYISDANDTKYNPEVFVEGSISLDIAYEGE